MAFMSLLSIFILITALQRPEMLLLTVGGGNCYLYASLAANDAYGSLWRLNSIFPPIRI
jgi:hypothetical protein